MSTTTMPVSKKAAAAIDTITTIPTTVKLSPSGFYGIEGIFPDTDPTTVKYPKCGYHWFEDRILRIDDDRAPLSGAYTVIDGLVRDALDGHRTEEFNIPGVPAGVFRSCKRLMTSRPLNPRNSSSSDPQIVLSGKIDLYIDCDPVDGYIEGDQIVVDFKNAVVRDGELEKFLEYTNQLLAYRVIAKYPAADDYPLKRVVGQALLVGGTGLAAGFRGDVFATTGRSAYIPVGSNEAAFIQLLGRIQAFVAAGVPEMRPDTCDKCRHVCDTLAVQRALGRL